MPTVATIGDSGMLSLSEAVGGIGMGGGQHSPFVGYNQCSVPRLGCPCKELLG